MPGYEGGGAQMIVFVFAAIVVVFGAFYVTRLIGRRSQLLGQGRTIRVRDRLFLARDKAVYLVEANGKTYLFAMTNNAVTLLDTFDADELSGTDSAVTGSFADIMRSFRSRRGTEEKNDVTGKRKNESDE